MEFLGKNTPSIIAGTHSEKAKYLPPLVIASIGAHWDLITESPNELIILLTNFSVKLNTHYTTPTY